MKDRKGSCQYRPAHRTIQLPLQPINDTLLMKLMPAVQSGNHILLAKTVKANSALLLVKSLPERRNVSTVDLLRSV